jgi:hypothetical protein
LIFSGIIHFEKIRIYPEILKAFLNSPPPLERESLIGIVEFKIPETTILSIPRRDCENYLFEGYQLLV